jgi:hypothetical protein
MADREGPRSESSAKIDKSNSTKTTKWGHDDSAEAFSGDASEAPQIGFC